MKKQLALLVVAWSYDARDVAFQREAPRTGAHQVWGRRGRARLGALRRAGSLRGWRPSGVVDSETRFTG